MTNQTDRCVAYLDLLGYKGYLKEDVISAIDCMQQVHGRISEKIQDLKSLQSLPADTDQLVKEKAIASSVDSFDMFLPLSDSVFITASDADRFVTQIAYFLKSCFVLNEHTTGVSADNPSDKTITVFGCGGSAESVRTKWYPLLFRGGISYGVVVDIPSQALIRKETVHFGNICGSAVAQAVKLENVGKGPRLFCDSAMRDALNSELRRFVLPVEVPNVNEVIWPAICCPRDSGELVKMFSQAFDYWRYFGNQQAIAVQYLEMMKLVTRSHILLGAEQGRKIALECINGLVDGEGGLKAGELMLKIMGV